MTERETTSGTENRRFDAVVVGGGVAGLTAGAFMAGDGLDVAVLEAKEATGGRARTIRQDGYALNLGPHALYRQGALARTARELGVEIDGGPGPTRTAQAVDGDGVHRLPVTPRNLLTSGALGWRGKLELVRILAKLGRLDPADHAGTAAGDWIDRRAERPGTRKLLRALVRLATYCPDDRLDAGAALRQLKMAADEGVLYLDDGWQSLVDGLRRAARRAGARVVTASRVDRVEWREEPLRVQTAEGRGVHARTAVLAVDPAEAARITSPAAPSLEAAADACRPVRAASLDLGLRRRPVADRAVALGLDAPLYLSDHAAAARLAPDNGAVIHAVRYLGADDPRPEADRARIESLLDRVQPGWRDEVEVERYLPGMTVAHDTPDPRRGGMEGRYGPGVEETRRLFVAGDWVGSTGLLSDAAAASAREAATAVCRGVRRWEGTEVVRRGG